ncbi:helix-turn-helix domain-containing protein [Grimontia hollisae]|uniref:helix-turn-helix domain-containing protein n=1 Tax=Grimontia hollisae TaxID=673 RepID=UPI00165E83AD|nr:helix-turn-helix transcriptional regulator [Grimontia hollisae]
MQKEHLLSTRLKKARIRAGFTQKELGIRIGMEPSSASGRMNHYEKGRHMPDVGTVRRLSKELGVPIAYFFCEDDLSAELICLIDKLSEKDKKDLIALLSQPNSK